jgi:hypothetical protein
MAGAPDSRSGIAALVADEWRNGFESGRRLIGFRAGINGLFVRPAVIAAAHEQIDFLAVIAARAFFTDLR